MQHHVEPPICPRRDCSGAVAYASLDDLRAGLPLWHCEMNHHGPRFVGFDGYAT